jgi:hypothetical protein
VTPLGLSLGADLGRLVFQDLASQLVVVGAPQYWAGQLAREAGAGEILINNRLYAALDGRTDIDMRARQVSPTAGEAYWARRLGNPGPSRIEHRNEKGGEPA